MDDLLSRSACACKQALADAAGRPVLARVTVEGTTALHAALAADPPPQGQIRALAAELGTCGPRRSASSPAPHSTEPGELHDLFQTLRDELRASSPTTPPPSPDYSEGLAPLVTAAAPCSATAPTTRPPHRPPRRLEASCSPASAPPTCPKDQLTAARRLAGPRAPRMKFERLELERFGHFESLDLDLAAPPASW
jgi:hypothetical protein